MSWENGPKGSDNMISPGYTRNLDVMELPDDTINIEEEIILKLTKACILDIRAPVKAWHDSANIPPPASNDDENDYLSLSTHSVRSFPHAKMIPTFVLHSASRARVHTNLHVMPRNRPDYEITPQNPNPWLPNRPRTRMFGEVQLYAHTHIHTETLFMPYPFFYEIPYLFSRRKCRKT